MKSLTPEVLAGLAKLAQEYDKGDEPPILACRPRGASLYKIEGEREKYKVLRYEKGVVIEEKVCDSLMLAERQLKDWGYTKK